MVVKIATPTIANVGGRSGNLALDTVGLKSVCKIPKRLLNNF
jgi:hypothetical protein